MKHMLLDRVPRQFCEGPFWGNGKMGTVLYVKDRALYFSIDHVTLWELRETLPDQPKADFKTILANKEKFLSGDPEYVEDTNIFDRAVGRTKLPAMGVSMELPADVISFYSDTDLETAKSSIHMILEDQSELTAKIWLDSLENVLNVEIEGKRADLILPKAKGWDQSLEGLKVLKGWNYPACTEKNEGGRFCMEQPFGGDKLAVLIGDRQIKEGQLNFTVTIATGSENQKEELEKEGKELLDSYIPQKTEKEKRHREDWNAFWEVSSVSVPNERIQEAYIQELYKIYCNERADSMPVTLQGVWNPNNRMPAWFGDLHNDLNVQSCYWAAFKTGRAELARPYVEYYGRAIPRFKERAKKLFGIDDAIHIPTMMAPDGSGAASEWCFWNIILGPELFVATDFCWYFEYTKDIELLKQYIYPMLKGVITLYEGIAYEGEDGFYHIPFTSSPEIGDSNGMIIRDDATITLSVLHYVLEHLKSYCVLAGEAQEAKRFEDFNKKLAPVVTNETGYPLFAGRNVFASHRHFCQMYPIFPLGVDTHSETAEKSLDMAINQGFLEYAAFSFPYMSIFASRCARGNMARTMLELYCMGFRSRNSFTVNGDPYQNGLLRISDTNAGESSDAFTLESGFFIPAAVSDMFVHRSQNTIWMLCGIPDEWKDCSCSKLTVEGGHKISIVRENYTLKSITILAEYSEELVLRWRDKEELSKLIINEEETPFHLEDGLKLNVRKGDIVKLFF